MRLFYLFTYTLFLSIALTTLFPFWHMLYFAPFIVFGYYYSSLSRCIWWSILCGFIVDLFSAETSIGNFAINYCITTLFLYRFQFHFFQDRLSTLPVMTLGFTFLSTIIQVAIFYLMSRPIAFSSSWFFYDFILTPIQTGIYAIIAFTIPSLVLMIFKRRYSLSRFRRR